MSNICFHSHDFIFLSLCIISDNILLVIKIKTWLIKFNGLSHTMFPFILSICLFLLNKIILLFEPFALISILGVKVLYFSDGFDTLRAMKHMARYWPIPLRNKIVWFTRGGIYGYGLVVTCLLIFILKLIGFHGYILRAHALIVHVRYGALAYFCSFLVALILIMLHA